MNDRQQRILRWAEENFGPIARDPRERAARFLEEAVEAAQASGLPVETASKILHRTYARPKGILYQEIGGAQLTLEALAESRGIDAHVASMHEWVRITAKPKSWWVKKHTEKVLAGTAIKND